MFYVEVLVEEELLALLPVLVDADGFLLEVERPFLLDGVVFPHAAFNACCNRIPLLLLLTGRCASLCGVCRIGRLEIGQRHSLLAFILVLLQLALLLLSKQIFTK